MHKYILVFAFVFAIVSGCKEDEITQTPAPPTGTLIYEKDSLNLEGPDTTTTGIQRTFVLNDLDYGSIRVEFDGETNLLIDSLYYNRMLKIHCNTFGNISFGSHQYQTAAAINKHQVANILNGYGGVFDLVFHLQFPPFSPTPTGGTMYVRFKNIKVYDTSGS
jgi:hypothetical protein